MLAGLLERREGGRHATMAEILTCGRYRHAAVYALALPLLRDAAAAGWTVADVVAELDSWPHPTTSHPDPGKDEIRNVVWPARFLAYRLSLADLSAPPATLRAARDEAERQAAEVEAARRRAELAEAVPLNLSTAADAWADLRARFRRRLRRPL